MIDKVVAVIVNWVVFHKTCYFAILSYFEISLK